MEQTLDTQSFHETSDFVTTTPILKIGARARPFTSKLPRIIAGAGSFYFHYKNLEGVLGKMNLAFKQLVYKLMSYL